MDDFVVYEGRLIAYLDILGFSNYLEDTPLQELHVKLARLIDRIRKQNFSPPTLEGSKELAPDNFEEAIFSYDSIMLVSKDLSDIKNTANFIFAVIMLLEDAFKEQFPLRGCVAGGDFLYDTSRDIFISEVFPSLVDMEKDQNWSGCFLCPEVEEKVLEAVYGDGFYSDENKKLSQGQPLLPFNVPFKGKGKHDLVDESLWCFNWMYFLNSKEVGEGLGYLVSPIKEKTEEFVSFVMTLPEDVQGLSAEFLPATKMKTMKARSCMRIKFSDENDLAVEPGCKSFQVIACEV